MIKLSTFAKSWLKALSNRPALKLEALANNLKIKVDNDDKNKQIVESFHQIYTALKAAKESGRDSIWKFIVQNLYKPYFLSNKFDYVIGNPPWFTYSSIRNEEYQNTLDRLAKDHNVKSEKKADYPHLEIAAIFLAYCSRYFLKKAEGSRLSLLTEIEANWFYVKRGSSSAFSCNKATAQKGTNPYKKHFKQGATIVPRTFYFVELNQEMPPDFEDRIINIKTAESVKSDAKKPWKELSFVGRVESQFLFRSALAKSILPFAVLNPNFVVLPITVENNKVGDKFIELYSANELLEKGFLNAAKWFQKTENLWEEYKTEKSKNMTSNDRLDFRRGLVEQNLNAPYLVLYNSSAKDANATVVKRSDLDLDFLVDHKTYWFASASLNEAYYLTAIFNSNFANLLMKDFQSRGLFGARDVHKKILDIYYPRFNAKDETHLKLAQLSETAHQKTSTFLADTPPHAELTATRLGRLRLDIKRYLAEEMQQIDELVEKLIS